MNVVDQCGKMICGQTTCGQITKHNQDDHCLCHVRDNVLHGHNMKLGGKYAIAHFVQA